MDAEVNHRTLTSLDNLILNLALYLGSHLFNTCWVDTPVLNKLIKSQASNLSTNRVKATQYNRLRSIIYNYLHPCSGFKSTYITPLSPDDTALHLIIFDMENRHGILNRSLSSNTLNTLYHQLFSLLISSHPSLLYNFIDIGSGTCTSFITNTLYQLCLCILCR